MKRKNRRQTDQPKTGRPALVRSRSHSPAKGILEWFQSPWVLGLLLFVATLLAFQPAWHAGFIWDDDVYVINNPLLTAPDGLWHIWFSLDSPSQYFPLTYTVFRLEHALWGFNPVGYHGVNVLLHAANALLIWRLLKRLNLPGAWLAAAIFALHPVTVEAVAWVTELKSVLSLFFILLTLLCWIEFVSEPPKQPLRWYGLALVFFALALFSKTTACTLPAAMLLILWLKHKLIDWRRLLQIVPFLLLGAGMGLVTIWWERHQIGTRGEVFSLGWQDRILVASHAVWFYLGKLFWPVNLAFNYPKWTLHPGNPLAYGWLLASVLLGAAVYFARHFVGRSVEVALLFFVATLSPLLGFIMLYTFRYSFVADHYQYVACLGPIALVAAGMTIGLNQLDKKAPFLKPMICGALLLTLAVLTWRQCGMYSNLETLWRATIQSNPGSYLAHNDLGFVLLNTGRPGEAAGQFQKALDLNSNLAETHYNLGVALAKLGRNEEALEQYQIALKLNPDFADVQEKLGLLLMQWGRMDEAAAHFQRAVQLNPDYAEAHYNLGNCLLRTGQIPEAIAHYERAVAIDPQFVPALNNLAVVLATCPDASVRNGPRAVALAESANQLSGGVNPVFLGTLASAYAEAGRFPEAVATAQHALQLAATRNNATLISTFQMQLGFYQKGLPFRDLSLTNAPP